MKKDQLKNLTDEALTIVTLDRNGQYGEPENNFGTIASLWGGYLKARKFIPQGGYLTAEDVARMMQLFKMARRMTSKEPYPDSFVDAIGYTLCEAKCAELFGKLDDDGD